MAEALVTLGEAEGGRDGPTAAGQGRSGGWGRRSASAPAPGVTASVRAASAASPPACPALSLSLSAPLEDIIPQIIHRAVPAENDPRLLCVMSAAPCSSSVRPVRSGLGWRMKRGGRWVG